MISDEVNPEDDKHLHEIKDRILAADKARLKRLSVQYKKEPDFDATKGQCCCKFENASGAKCIMMLDCVIIPIFIRWVFAVWA